MKSHVKIYFDYFGYNPADVIPCELCNATAVDIHHIEARGIGGTIEPDNIDNLMALCRSDHLKYGDVTDQKPFLKMMHQKFMEGNKR